MNPEEWQQLAQGSGREFLKAYGNVALVSDSNGNVSFIGPTGKIIDQGVMTSSGWLKRNSVLSGGYDNEIAQAVSKLAPYINSNFIKDSSGKWQDAVQAPNGKLYAQNEYTNQGATTTPIFQTNKTSQLSAATTGAPPSQNNSGLPAGYSYNPSLPAGYVQGPGNSIKLLSSIQGTQPEAPSGTPEPSSTEDALLGSLESFLARLAQNGQMINPNIEITPEKLAEFTKLAESEINPYYSGQLKLARQSFLSDLGYSTDQILLNEQNLEKKYRQGLQNIASNSAESGMALSGARNIEEQQLGEQAQQEIEQNRKKLSYEAGKSASQFAQKYGTSELPQYSMTSAPTIMRPTQGVTADTSVFSKGTSQSPVYSLSPDVYEGIVGSEEYQRRADISRRQSELESAFRTKESLNQQRKITL